MATMMGKKIILQGIVDGMVVVRSFWAITRDSFSLIRNPTFCLNGWWLVAYKTIVRQSMVKKCIGKKLGVFLLVQHIQEAVSYCFLMDGDVL